MDEVSKTFKESENFFKSSINKFKKNIFNTNGHVELFVLSYIFPYPIIVYNNFDNVKYLYLKGRVKVSNNTIKNFTDKNKLKNSILLKFDFEGSNNIPTNIYSIYYK